MRLLQYLSFWFFKVFFIESICDDPDVIEQNLTEVKLNGPDYRNKDPEVAMRDFKLRMKHYESAYEAIDEDLDKLVERSSKSFIESKKID